MIFSIDPGCEQSAYLSMTGSTILDKGKCDNATLVSRMLAQCSEGDQVVIEKITCYGMKVGREVFETAFWIGRFAERALNAGLIVHRVTRMDVKVNATGSSQAGDKLVRLAMIRIYGEPGTAKAPGPTYGVTKDIWSALAIAHFWTEVCHGRRSRGRSDSPKMVVAESAQGTPRAIPGDAIMRQD